MPSACRRSRRIQGQRHGNIAPHPVMRATSMRPPSNWTLRCSRPVFGAPAGSPARPSSRTLISRFSPSQSHCVRTLLAAVGRAEWGGSGGASHPAGGAKSAAGTPLAVSLLRGREKQGKQSRGLETPGLLPLLRIGIPRQLSQPSTTLWWASTHFFAAASGAMPPWISVATEFWSSLVQVNALASLAAGEPLSSSFLDMILLSL